MINCKDFELLTEQLRLEIEEIEKQNIELTEELRKERKVKEKFDVWLDCKKIKHASLIKKSHKKR